jgi:hypothetical protein
MDNQDLLKAANSLLTGQHVIHNVIKRNFNIVVQYELDLTNGANNEEEKGKQRLYVDYCKVFMKMIHGHHQTEEEYWFPTVSKGCNVNLDHFVDKHKQLDKIWADIDQLLLKLSQSLSSGDQSTKNEEILNDLKQVKDLFRQLQQEMVPHLDAEEETISTELVMKHYSTQQMKEIEEKTGKVAQSHMGDASTEFPLFYYSMSNEERATMGAHFPWILKRVIMPWVWYRKWSKFIPMYYNYNGDKSEADTQGTDNAKQ